MVHPYSPQQLLNWWHTQQAPCRGTSLVSKGFQHLPQPALPPRSNILSALDPKLATLCSGSFHSQSQLLFFFFPPPSGSIAWLLSYQSCCPMVWSQVGHTPAVSLITAGLWWNSYPQNPQKGLRQQRKGKLSAHSTGPWLTHRFSTQGIFSSCSPSCPDQQSCSQRSIPNTLQQCYFQG